MATLTLKLGTGGALPGVLVLPVAGARTGDHADTADSTGAAAATDAADAGTADDDAAADGLGTLLPTTVDLPAELLATLDAYRLDVEHSGSAGTVHTLPRPGARPRRVLLVGIGAGTEADWRAVGAAVDRAVTKDRALTLALPDGTDPAAVAGLAEGMLLAHYRFRLASGPDDNASQLRQVTIATRDPDRYADALASARIVAETTCLARDWTNTPSNDKSPSWLANAVTRQATKYKIRSRVRDADELRTEGFGGILAVGGGSPRPPRLVELRWRPRGATRHVVLIGKGITYDTGGIQIKPTSGMQLMRKDMGGAAAVAAATIGAARLGLNVKITTLLPMADNFISGSSYRPGDIVRHYGGLTSEIRNTDAEGRVVLGDAIAYAVRRLAPDVLIDMATLTGAQGVALGKKIAALYAGDDALAADLADSARDAGEPVWRMPLPDDYVDQVDSDIADLNNAPDPGKAGSVLAALYLREFTGDLRDRWLHVDMSGPSWSASADGVHAKGATGWGVRTLLRYLSGPSDAL